MDILPLWAAVSIYITSLDFPSLIVFWVGYAVTATLVLTPSSVPAKGWATYKWHLAQVSLIPEIRNWFPTGRKKGESIPLPLLPSSTSQEEGGEGIASFPLFSVLLPVKDILPVTCWEKRCPGSAHGQGADRDAACSPRVRVTCRKEGEHKSTYQLLQGGMRSVVPQLHLVLN